MRPPSVVEKAAAGLVLGIFSRLRAGRLEVRLPDGSRRGFGAANSAERGELWVRDWRFFPRVALDGDIGFGEAYMADEFDSPDLTALIRLLIQNEEAFVPRYMRLAWARRLGARLMHALRRNDLRGSRKNIRDHYDLGNEMFGLFLDESMTYSCALFSRPDETLEAAQRNKRLSLIRKARIGPGHHVLEIGSGWGAFAVDAVRETGCRVTTITLSDEQLRYVRELVRREGLEDRIAVELRDYRQVSGAFDRIVSIEMIEAVGHEYLGRYFAAVDRLLKPDGLAVIQAITIPDQRYEAFRKGCDWIQKHIFPGSVVPSLSAMTEAMTRDSRLIVESLENIGIHYAPTLRKWRERFSAGRSRMERLGYGREFQRRWEYYFCYCEAGFASRVLGDLQLVLTRPNNRSLPAAEELAVC